MTEQPPSTVPLFDEDPYKHMLRVDSSPWTIIKPLPYLAGPIRTALAFIEDYINVNLQGDATVKITVEIPAKGGQP